MMTISYGKARYSSRTYILKTFNLLTTFYVLLKYSSISETISTCYSLIYFVVFFSQRIFPIEKNPCSHY